MPCPRLLLRRRYQQPCLPVAGVRVRAPCVQAGGPGIERVRVGPVQGIAVRTAGYARRPKRLEDLDGETAAVWRGVHALVGALDCLAELVSDGIALWRNASIEHDRVEIAIGDGLAVGLEPILGVIGEE